MRTRAALLALMLLGGCPSIDVEKLRFRCGGDEQCISGWVCDPVDRICVLAADAKDAGFAPDAGEVCTNVGPSAKTCGFEAGFRGEIPADFHAAGSATCTGEGWLLAGDRAQAGAMWNLEKVTLDHFQYEMAFRINPIAGGAAHGEGLTLAWIEGSERAIGPVGKYLGAPRTPGYYVELDTVRNMDPACSAAEEPNAPHVALVRAEIGAETDDICADLDTIATATVAAVGDGEPHTLRVELDIRGQALGMAAVSVFVDGVVAIERTISYQTFDARYGATAGTSAAADRFIVSRLELSCN